MGHEPEEQFFKLECPHCQTNHYLKVVGTFEQVEAVDCGNIGEFDAGPVWKLTICRLCNGVSLLRYFYHEAYFPEDTHLEVVYPASGETFKGLPEEIDRAHRAALRVRGIDSNAYAVLLGRVIEMVCAEQGVREGALNDRLGALSRKGVIPEQLALMGHGLRNMRNIGAHADLGELTEADVPYLDSLCKAILEYIYVAPRLIDEVQKRVEAIKTQRHKDA